MILVDPGQQRFIAGEDTTGDGSALNVRALYQRCPHLGCKPNPCLKNFWFECPCHGSRYDRLGHQGRRRRSSARRRAAWTASRSRSTATGVLTINTGKITLGPLPGRPRPARAHPAAHADGLHLMPSADAPGEGTDDRHARSSEPEQRLPVPRPPAEPAPVERFTSPPSTRAVELHAGARRPGRPPVVERPLGRLPGGRRRDPVRRHLLVLRAGAARLHASRGSRPRPTRSRSPRSSAATTCTRRTARAATAPNGEGGIGPASTARTSCTRTSTATTSTTCWSPAAATPAATPTRSCRSGPNAGHPPGPLNYIQIEDLIAFIRAPNNADLHHPRPRARRAEDRPDHRRGQDVQRLGRPRLQAGARRDAVPGLLVATRSRPTVRSPASGRRVRPARRPARPERRPSGRRLAAVGRSTFDRRRRLTGPGRRARSSSTFDNQDAGVAAQRRRSRTRPARSSSSGEIFTGVATRDLPGAGARGREPTRSCAPCTRR